MRTIRRRLRRRRSPGATALWCLALLALGLALALILVALLTQPSPRTFGPLADGEIWPGAASKRVATPDVAAPRTGP